MTSTGPTSGFPAAIDTWTTKKERTGTGTGQEGDPVRADHVNRLQSAVANLQEKVGIDIVGYDPTKTVTEHLGYLDNEVDLLKQGMTSTATVRDSGWRDMKPPAIVNGIPELYVRMRRIGDIVFVAWSTTWDWIRVDRPNRCKVPVGFHPAEWYPAHAASVTTNPTGSTRLAGSVDPWESWNGSGWTHGDWQGASSPRRELAHELVVVKREGDPNFQPEGAYVYHDWYTGVDSLHLHGSGSFVTDDPWPKTLPGTAVAGSKQTLVTIPMAGLPSHAKDGDHLVYRSGEWTPEVVAPPKIFAANRNVQIISHHLTGVAYGLVALPPGMFSSPPIAVVSPTSSQSSANVPGVTFGVDHQWSTASHIHVLTSGWTGWVNLNVIAYPAS